MFYRNCKKVKKNSKYPISKSASFLPGQGKLFITATGWAKCLKGGCKMTKYGTGTRD